MGGSGPPATRQVHVKMPRELYERLRAEKLRLGTTWAGVIDAGWRPPHGGQNWPETWAWITEGDVALDRWRRLAEVLPRFPVEASEAVPVLREWTRSAAHTLRELEAQSAMRPPEESPLIGALREMIDAVQIPDECDCGKAAADAD